MVTEPRKQKWVRAKSMGIGRYVRCPYCPDLREIALNESMPWCASCGCEYRITPLGATFDPTQKTPRYALGKAFNAIGGVRIGKVAE